jgi:hypothetical protein
MQPGIQRVRGRADDAAARIVVLSAGNDVGKAALSAQINKSDRHDDWHLG